MNPSTILTLELDQQSQRFFEALRQEHYPAGLNQIPAHLTLFHKLPPVDEIIGQVQRAAHRPIFQLRVTGLRSLGRGVAYTLQSAELASLHAELSQVFLGHLTAQDQQPFRPHVVVQNKVDPATARELTNKLQRDFAEFEVQAVGLLIWNYLEGPWLEAEFFNFAK